MEAGAAPIADSPEKAKETPQFSFDWQKVVSSPAFMPGVVALFAICVAFWPLLRSLPNLWMSEDGYYSHGFLVPLISGFLVYRWWNVGPRLWDTFAALTITGAVFVPVLHLVQGKFGSASLTLTGLILIGGVAVTGLQYLVEKSVFMPTGDEPARGLSSIPVRPFLPAALLLLPILWLLNPAYTQGMDSIMSALLLATLIVAIWFVAGGRWAVALSLPVLYLIFALPVWTMIINVYTNPLQIVSTDVAYGLLRAFGLDTYREDSTTIILNRFTLNVAIPCSGLKLLLALSAFTALFMMIAKLRWWGNLAMAVLLIPLALFINGLRIALIGVVGNEWGSEAGMKFHDYSGYITLIICFLILFKFARLLGWKD